jgi:hypothetical protein
MVVTTWVKNETATQAKTRYLRSGQQEVAPCEGIDHERFMGYSTIGADLLDVFNDEDMISLK